MESPDKKKLATIALALFIAGVAGSFLVRSFAVAEMAMGFGAVCMLLALIFGFISRGYLFGKIAMIGALVLVMITCAQFIGFQVLKGRMQSEMSKELEAKSRR